MNSACHTTATWLLPQMLWGGPKACGLGQHEWLVLLAGSSRPLHLPATSATGSLRRWGMCHIYARWLRVGEHFAQMYGSTSHDSGPGPAMNQPCSPYLAPHPQRRPAPYILPPLLPAVTSYHPESPRNLGWKGEMLSDVNDNCHRAHWPSRIF